MHSIFYYRFTSLFAAAKNTNLLFFILSAFILNGCQFPPEKDHSVGIKPDTQEPVAKKETTDPHQKSETRHETTQVDLSLDDKPHDILFPEIPLDTWDRIRGGFSLPEVEHKRITQQLNWFKRHPEYMKRVAERAGPYLSFITHAIEEAGMPSEIALLPIVESAFQPFAYSHGRAAGIWQFIPSTGRQFGLKQNWWYDGRRDVYASTYAAIRFLKKLHLRFKGDWMLALAAYNSGDGTVRKAIRRNKRRGKPTDFFSLHLPRETRAYVPKLIALKRIVANPSDFDIVLDPIPDKPYFEKVKLKGQIDLALAAELAEIPLDDLYRLNAGFNRWATSPSGPYDLLIPIKKVKKFKTNLAEVPADKRLRWIRHRVRKGETLGTIAQKFHTSITTIKRINRLRGKVIRAGRSITIPVASRSLREYRLSASQRRNKLQNIPRQGRKVSHIVQSGDTIWDLARYHRVGVRQLARWNSMAPRDTLQAGQKLIIWSRRGDSVSSIDLKHISAPPRRKITKRIGYRVRIGDSLARISNKFNVSIAQLKRWNAKLRTQKYIQPGQYITLIVDVARQSGNSNS